MAPKKAAGRGAAGAKAAAGGAGKKPKDVLWAEAQIQRLEAQRKAGPAWLQEPHSWHEGQLDLLASRLADASLPEVPQQLREDVEFYVSQFDGQETSEEDFYEDRSIFDEALYSGAAPGAGDAAEAAPYVRAETTEAEAAAAKELREWSDSSVAGLSSLLRMLAAHDASAEVQQAGLTRLGALIAEAAGAGGEGLAGSVRDLAAGGVATMQRFARDAGVQKAACAALRSMAKAPGGIKPVAAVGAAEAAGKAMKVHVGDVEVCRAGAGLLYAMVQETDAASPERMVMRSAGLDVVLREALARHPTDHGLDWAVRVAMPELRG